MNRVNKTHFDVAEGMPVSLAAKLEHSSSLELFRIAADHHLQYMTLMSSAWKDIDVVVDWFLENKRYSEAIDWVCENTPDSLVKTLTIAKIIDAEKLTKN